MKIIINIGWAVMFFAAATISAQDYTLPNYTMTTGGGSISGGNFQINSSIGQVATESAMSGGQFEIDGGFLPGVDTDSILLGDVNQDGFVNLLDVNPFVDLLTNGEFLPEADINSDGAVDLLDVAGFVDLLAG